MQGTTSSEMKQIIKEKKQEKQLQISVPIWRSQSLT